MIFPARESFLFLSLSFAIVQEPCPLEKERFQKVFWLPRFTTTYKKSLK